MSVVSRERQAQTAAQKLTHLGAAVRLSPDRRTLEGMMTFSGRLVAPVSANNIRRAPFLVEGGELLRFVAPPLDVLGAMAFLDVADQAAFEKRVQTALQRRMGAIVAHDSRLKALRVQTAMDPERLVAVGTATAGDVRFDVEVDPEGVHVVRVFPGRARPFEVPRSFPALRIEDLEDALDFELHLNALLPELEAVGTTLTEKEDQTEMIDVAGGALSPLPPRPGTPALALLLERFGAHAAAAKVEVVSEYTVGKKRFRFSAYHESGTTFRGRLLEIDEGEDRLWADSFDLAAIGSVDEMVASIIGVQSLPQPGQKPVVQRRAQTAPPARVPGPATGRGGFDGQPETAPAVPDLGMPQPGEVWVMRVVVERDDGREVRYHCVDADGRPYGAPRVLSRGDFQQVFAHGRDGGFQLCVLVEELRGDKVVYRQLDAGRVPSGERISLPVTNLAAAFVPEASLY